MTVDELHVRVVPNLAAFHRAIAEASERLRAITRPTETTMSDPNPLTLEQLVHDLREQTDDASRASGQTQSQYDVAMGALRALDECAGLLSGARAHWHNAGSSEDVARAQGIVLGVAWCLRGLHGVLPDES